MKLMKLAGNEKTTMYKNILFNHFKLFLYFKNRKKKKKKEKERKGKKKSMPAQEINFMQYFTE